MIYAIIIIAVIVIVVATAIALSNKSNPPKKSNTYTSKKIYSAQMKGQLGETQVSRILGNTIKGEQYVINDLLFMYEPGQSCQIDHIFINKFGIWVIETKNYAGTIYGQENQQEWTQVLAFGNTKNKFYNPIKQNLTHIYHLSRYLKVQNIFHNVVVFLSDANISNIHSNNVYTLHSVKAIKEKKTDIFLSVEKMEYYYNKLLNLHDKTAIKTNEHIENVHKMQRQIQQGICPRCGGKLMLRTGKNGQFYGCSGFPKCRFTKNIK